jgi:ribosomal-protein-alanine N-acetyltransferase
MQFNRDIRDRAPAPSRPMPPPSPRQTAVTIERVGWLALPEVAALQRRAFRPQLAYGLSTLIVLKLLPNVRFLVARAPASQGGQILGCGIGDRHQGQTRVINLAVDPTARRRGVGAALLRGLEAALPHGDILLMVEEANEAARALYLREGYLPVGTATNYYGRGRSGIWMQKARPGAGGGAPPKLWV